MNIRTYINWIMGILLALTSLSCNDFLTQEPENGVTNLNYWRNEQDVESAVYGMHSEFRDCFGNVVILYRDRAWPFDVLGNTWTKISNLDMSDFVNNSPEFSWWREYDVIVRANLILDNIYRADLPEGREHFYTGQALCIRAYTYFNIIRCWGDAPLVTKSEDVGEKPRTAWQDIAAFIIKDLQEAAKLLPPAGELKYADGGTILSKQIPSRQTANAILAQAYAWMAGVNHQPELWAAAAVAADAVINSGDYDLVGTPEEVCEIVLKGNSREGILELNYDKNSPNDLKDYGSYIAGACQRWPIQSMTTVATKRTPRINNSTIMALYPDVTDGRRDAYFWKLDSMADVATTTTQGAAYIQKWRHPLNWTDGAQTGRIRYYEDNDILIRLADIILLRAEAKEKLGDSGGAIADLDRVRERAGAKKYSASEGSLAEAIATERERELFLEGINTRYYDIVRNGTFREKLRGGFKTLTDEDVRRGALFLPVSSDVARYNTLARQTEYWTAVFPF